VSRREGPESGGMATRLGQAKAREGEAAAGQTKMDGTGRMHVLGVRVLFCVASG
jgi:hypothetical protein